MSLRTLYDEASLWMTPGGYEDGKLFSELPTDGSGDFTFSRGSNLAATRVGPTGLIEKGRENLLLQSNQFDTSPFLTLNANVTSGQSGYDGTNDAWELNATAAAGRLYQSIVFSGVHTFSMYAKSGTADGLRVRFDQTSDTNVYVNLTDGSVSSSGNTIDIDIQDAGSGWYRITFAFNASGMNTFILYPTDGNVTSITGSVFIQDAQIEKGLVATDYIETGASAAKAGILEDMPRLDYSGSCPALLLEPQRTNDAAHSEYISAFNNLSAINVDDNVTTSPEGVNNAALIYADATSNQHYISNNHSYTSGTAFTISIFAKVRDYDYFFFRVQDFMSPSNTIFNLASGTLATAGNEDSYKIESLNDGWYRISVTYTPTSTAVNNNGLRLGFSPTAAYSYTGDNSSGGYVYGYQWEQGSYPTSYIPTYGSSVTRSRDDMDTTFSSALTSSGSVSVLFDFGAAYISDSNSTTNNLEFVFDNGDRIIYNQNSVSQHRIELNVNGGTEFIYKTFGILRSVPAKICVVVTNKEYRIFVNGQLTSSFGSFTGTADWTAAERFASDINEPIGVTPIKQMLLFPTALTDSECIALTTL